jgi:hypothetical protein
MKSSLSLLTIACAAFGSTACASAADNLEETSGQVAPVTIHWTDLDSKTGEVVLRTTEITREQADWLLDARERNRLSSKPPAEATPAPSAPAEHIGTESSALTLGSTSWTDCQSYEWMLVRSAPNNEGSIFCAKWASGFMNSVAIPFVPRYYDAAAASSAFFNLCTHPSSCYVRECGTGSDVWTTIYQSSGSGNINPPSSVRFVVAQNAWIVC